MKLVVLSLFASSVLVTGEHPVEGVITLLKNLKDQVKTEGQTEEVTYSKFAKWCADSKKTLGKAVKASEDSIESLKPEIEGLVQENETLTTEIADLGAEIAKHNQDETDANTKRTDENGLYVQADADFGTTIQAFEDAITALENVQTQAGAASLIQSVVSTLPIEALAHLTEHQASLLSTLNASSAPRPDLLASGDWAGHQEKYTFRSGNVVELLKDLKTTFEEQRVEATKAETNAVNAHALAADARTNAITAATSTKTAKETRLGDCQGELSTAKSSLSDAEDDLVADKGTLDTTKKTCQMKATEWEERVATRAREQEALSAGIKILAKVSGVRTEKPTNPVPPAPPADAPPADVPPDFLQIQPAGAKDVMMMLRKEATKLHSKSFMHFTQELESKLGGPFDEVNNMIQKMIFRLMAEQKDEDDHKNWCDLELSKTTASRDDKGEKLTQLGLKLTSARADVGACTQAISDANDALTKINDFVTEATDIRNKGKEENKAAIKDAQEAAAALAKAIALLSDFYKETGMVAKEAWEFAQKSKAPVTLSPDPSTWDSPYTGVADPKKPGGVITLLETIASDFATMEAETKAQEATDETNFQEEMKTQEIEKARRTKEVELKEQEKQRLNDKIVSLEKSEKHTKEEKEAMEQYLKDLEPACVEGDSTYDARKQARTDEIDALKEAQVILADANNITDSSSGGGAFAQIRYLRG